MRPVDKLAGARTVSRLGLAGLLGILAVGAAPASIAQDQPAPAAQPATPAPAQPAAPSSAAPSATTAQAAPAAPPDVVQDCAACHGMAKDAAPSVGPNLWGVVGRQAGSTDYAYSPAMKAYGKAWTPENLQAFIMSPATAVPGTAMMYPGVPDPATAKAVVDYLATLKG